MDKAESVIGWQAVEEVQRDWLAGNGGMLLSVEVGCYEVIETVDLKRAEATNAK